MGGNQNVTVSCDGSGAVMRYLNSISDAEAKLSIEWEEVIFPEEEEQNTQTEESVVEE